MAILKNSGLAGLNVEVSEPSEGQNPGTGKHLFPFLYFGEVRKNNDEDRMGRVWVYIKEIDGDRDSSQHWHRLTYCSPFGGATPTSEVGDVNSFSNSQVSYGAWFPVPDIGNIVLCGFVNGDPNKGVWFGNAFKQMMNHMVPGIPASATVMVIFLLASITKIHQLLLMLKGQLDQFMNR
ncbi:MAG: hypothetical protein HC836_10760 [Richelia sp. RM2_1_2]|nr:hypothetical protein [Richelia sp. RM2_1_2]